ncbi:uncharacterized protein BO72DRAFT_444395 [Aspergillus fijiensis CBS 313.89]|uniref:CBM-cenC domain-containing protein n=1 Tax=Aspergillus fijiensis CBS 313.89 TaxID=1448319 RepID=A0A8G1W5L0_9EURO|nr:uncharacterized protein BO72DRAFT_444395 [Aspergillus fijiensis CBS 313.89]RAK81334.1 hypothetical protein BO72DRAFT_444395 [Aspergillus fijiensis CBS 313.89]
MKMIIRSSLLALLATTASAVGTGACTTSVQQAVQNPSFEDGTIDWTIATGAAGSVYDTYRTSSAPDGSYVIAINGDLASNGLSQTLTDLAVGSTYTLSLYWQLLSIGTGTCSLNVYIDSAESSNVAATGQLTSASSAWTHVTGQWTATSTTHKLMVDFTCTAGSFSSNSEVNFDDITFTGPTVVNCPTSTAQTLTSTPIPTPSVASASSSTPVVAMTSSSSPAATSSPVLFTSVPVQSSSSAFTIIPSVRPSSAAVRPSSSFPVQASSASSSVRVTPSLSTPAHQLSASSASAPSSSAAVQSLTSTALFGSSTAIAATETDVDVVTSTVYATVTATFTVAC